MSKAQSEFLEIFRDEATERLDRIVDTLLGLERGEGGPDAVALLLRETHTLKGAAGMIGLDEVRALAHGMEDQLSEARDSGRFPAALAEPLLRAADSLRALVGVGCADPLPDAEPPASQAPTSISNGEARAIRVPSEKIDALLELVDESVHHRRRLEHSLGDTIAGDSEQVTDELTQGARLVDDLKDAAIGMRTLPLDSITGSLPRAVRDLASAEGKEVDLIVSGGDTELDRVILEGLSDPLVHLFRNSVAHGIEPSEERERVGKPRAGRLELRAEQRGRLIEVTVADDGRGVPREIVEQAAQAGSLADVLAKPGFSTAGGVTELAGRGVGLDAVKSHVEAFGGSLEVRSEPGRGTEVVLQLPMALALLEVLLVERGAGVYGVPLASVEEVIAVTERLSLGGASAIEVHGRSVPLADLAELLGTSAPVVRDAAPAVVLSGGGRRIGITCDAMIGKEEVVVKSLAPMLASLKGYLGAAVLGDGRIALLLDPAGLVRASGEPAQVAPAAEIQHVPKVLVVEDSYTVRELQRSILEAAGYSVDTARNGKEALQRLTRDGGVNLVMSDVEMPEMDGIQLTQSIRAMPERASLPVVIVTSRAGPQDRQRGIDAGADAYMVKRDFDQRELLGTIERLIGELSPMRVLICEDSTTYAAVLSHALRADLDVDVAAVCRTAEEAVALVPRLKPDVVTMDMELPGMSGLEAIEQIMNAHPVPILLLSSDAHRDTAAALAAGALDAMGKGNLNLADPRGAAAVSFRERLKVLAGVRVIRHPRGTLKARASATAHTRTASVIGICASTGGPQALATMLARVPESFPVPVVVVQHIGAGFTDGLVRWLDGAIGPSVRIATPPADIGPGVWIAPEGAHLVLRAPGRLVVDSRALAGLHRPSGDILFASLAATAGPGAVGVVLTGMGSDGAAGLEAIRLAGGLTIAQDETSSVVFGMPRAAVDMGAELVLPPTEIGNVLAALKLAQEPVTKSA